MRTLRLLRLLWLPALALAVGAALSAASSFAVREALARGAERSLPALVLGGGVLASLLVAALVYALAVSRARAVRTAAEMRFAATHDALTGLANRILFHEHLTHALSRAARYHRGVAVLFLDLDRFKAVNDSLGHRAGDALLREIAQRLRSALRESDTVARLSGDEFAVVLEDYSSPREAVTVANKILTRIAAPVELEGRPHTPSASIGISVYPEDGRTLEALLGNADIAMYRAKAGGRNNHQFYSPEPAGGADARAARDAALRRAIERDELVLEYQARFDLASGAVAGIEALARWPQPGRTPMPAARLAALAEEAGFGAALGDWTLLGAARQARMWRELGLAAGRVAVGVSAQQLGRDNLPLAVREILATAGAAATDLELSVGDALLARDPQRVAKLLHRLRALGLALSIDDFGAGHTPLAVLEGLVVDTLRLDAAFVRNLPEDSNCVAIVQGVIALGRDLRLAVAARGVETAGQREFLIGHRCDQAQGGLLAEPLPAEDMTAFLRSARPFPAPASSQAQPASR